MLLKERKEIEKLCDTLSDEELEKLYYDTLFLSLGSQCDDMYDLGYDIQDIIERQKYEKFIAQKSDLIGGICDKRGIQLFV